MAQEISIINRWLFAAWGAILLGLGVIFQLNRGEWKDAFYYDGDNITLALALKSIIDGESFRWVFSSQSFIFPEGPLFSVAYLISENFKSALLTSTYLNISLIAVLIFLIARHIYADYRQTLLSTVLFIVFLIFSFNLEHKPDINSTTIITLILFTTYYVGVILVSLLQIWLYGLASNLVALTRLTVGMLIACSTGFACASNPLFLLQFVVPCLLLGAILTLTHDYRRDAIFVLCTSLGGAVIGFVIRMFLSVYTAASVSSYISIDRMYSAIASLTLSVHTGVNDPLILLLWSFWLLLFFFHGLVYIYALRQQEGPVGFGFIFFHAFCILSPIITLAGIVLSGNHLTRYLIPIPFFTMAGAALIAPVFFRSGLSHFHIVLVLLSGTLLTYISYLNVSKATPNAESNIECFFNYAKETNAKFVGSFATSRYLNLYSNLGTPIQQVDKEFKPLNWLSNRYEHLGDRISHVIVDKQDYPVLITTTDTIMLGRPRSVHECHDFYIYRYDPTSNGYKILNERVRQ